MGFIASRGLPPWVVNKWDENVGDLTCIQDHKSFILKNGDSYIHDEQTVKASIDVANYAKNYQRRQNARVSRSISTQ